MSKIPRVSGNQLIKYLVNKKGFEVSHRKGSHVSIHNDSKHKFTSVPSKNDDIGTGLMLQILDDCGITREEFVSGYQNGLLK